MCVNEANLAFSLVAIAPLLDHSLFSQEYSIHPRERLKFRIQNNSFTAVCRCVTHARIQRAYAHTHTRMCVIWPCSSNSSSVFMGRPHH